MRADSVKMTISSLCSTAAHREQHCCTLKFHQINNPFLSLPKSTFQLHLYLTTISESKSKINLGVCHGFEGISMTKTF